MHFPGIWRSKFTDFAGKKHNLWEKTAADESAWIKACHIYQVSINSGLKTN